MAYSFKCFSCGEISTSYNLINFYDYDQFVYKCKNPNCDRQFWMTVYSMLDGSFLSWKESVIYYYGEFSRVEATLYKYHMHYEFLHFYNNDNHNIDIIANYKISKAKDMVNFIIKYIDNLIFC